MNQCRYCGVKDDSVETQGIYYCPNPLCHACGASWFRRTLDSYKSYGSHHTCDKDEWQEKAREYIDNMPYKIAKKIMEVVNE